MEQLSDKVILFIAVIVGLPIVLIGVAIFLAIILIVFSIVMEPYY